MEDNVDDGGRRRDRIGGSRGCEVISQAGPYQDATPPTGQLHPEQWSDRTVTIADLGHATLLMNWYGVRVLTDPTLFNRVGMSVGSLLTIGPIRHSAPPLAPANCKTSTSSS